jgi:hypothetical protein
MLKSVIKSIYPYQSSDWCSVPAPSIAFRAGGWLAIAGQLRGKGRDRVSAAEPEENIVVEGVGSRGWGVGDWIPAFHPFPAFTGTSRCLISHTPHPTHHTPRSACI